jgi:hypothetical protein
MLQEHLLSTQKGAMITLSGSGLPYTIFFEAFTQKAGIKLGIIFKDCGGMTGRWPPAFFGRRKKQYRFFEHAKHLGIRSGPFFRIRPTDQKGPVRLLKGLYVSVKGVGKKMPTGMDPVSGQF